MTISGPRVRKAGEATHGRVNIKVPPTRTPGLLAWERLHAG